MPEEESVDIIDVENYTPSSGQKFSHSEIITLCIRKCVEAGTREMRTGWFNEKQDKRGNINRTYIDDTRKQFIESVKTLMMYISRDYDEAAETRIKDILKKIEDKEKELIKQTDDAWDNLSTQEKNLYLQEGEKHTKGKLDHPVLKKEFIDFQIEHYRKIVAEVSKLIKRLNDYQEEMYEA